MSGSQQLLLGGIPTAVPVDPYFYSVTSLLHGDGTNGGQNNTFLDSSTNNFTITRNGNTTQGSFSPFSQTGWGGYFDGSGDFLNFTKQTTTGSFTCECWFYRGEDQTNYHIVFGGSSASVGVDNNQMIVQNDGAVRLTLNATAIISASGTGSVAKNQWNHIAWVRSGTSCAIFVNGNRVGTGTSNAAVNIDRIGSLGGVGAGYDAIGYISNARITTTAVYDPSLTTCTVPTAPLTAVTGTYLLTLQSNRFVDNSASPLTITVNGNTSIQPFSPFNPTTAYSTSAVGGSGYFDGSGDYLSVPSNAAFGFGTGDFTIECWVNPSTQGGHGSGNNDCLLDFRPGSNGAYGTLYIFNSGAGVYWFVNSANRITGGAIPNNSWSHIVVSRVSGNTRLFINGVQSGSTYVDSTNYATTTVWAAQFNDGVGSGFFNGYFSDIRIVKGSGVTSVTVPTSPLTAITNTSLLLNFTNGAIFDNAAVADYETVGNAQISTSVKKYGTGSMYFDGSGDYLTTPYSQSINFGTGDFTIEGWFYLNSFANQYYVLGGTWSSATSDEWLIQIENNGSLRFLTTANTSFFATGLIKTGTWYHFAASRNAGVIKAYINGSVFATITNANSIGSVSKTLNIGQQPGGSWPWNGYLDDWRVTKGIGRYPYNFTPPTAEFPNIGGTVTLTADPYFDYTTLLLPGNGTNGAQNNTFLDSSTNAFTITRNGNTTQGTFSPFSQTGWGNYFDGSGDFLYPADNAAFAYGTGDFTVECWVYPTSLPGSGSNVIIDQRESTPSGGGFSLEYTSTGRLDIATSSVVLSSSLNLVTNQWQHVAMARNGTTLKLFINGTEVGSVSNSTNLTSQRVTIGAYTNRVAASSYFPGYISNARLVKGTAVYTSNFTPSTTPLTAITNTSLLTCQSNRFIDNSTNNFAITRNGDVSVQAFSPFNPTAAWSAATNGGSGYFDGSGDYLTAPDNAAFDLGAGAFTLECFAYLNARAGAYDTLIAQWNNSSDSWLFLLSGNTIQFYGNGALAKSESVTITTGQWYHFACTRDSSNNLRLYANGVKLGSDTAYSTTLINSTASPSIGCRGDGLSTTNFNGYLSSVRVIKGSAEYTGSTYTVPTAPLTAITNTSLLLNYTNAGITDATSKNDLETVGNAQISTTQSKFGGSSMYFDGTGDYCLFPVSQNFAFGTGDFTLECWIRTNRVTQSLFGLESGTGSYGLVFAAGDLYWQSSTMVTNLMNASATSILDNNWHHVALTRYNGTSRMFFDGVQVASVADSTSYTATTKMNVGYQHTSTNYYLGYIQDIRITKGIARYTSNFIPPSTAFLTL